VSSKSLRRDFLFSLGLVVLSDGESSVIVGAVSPRPFGGCVTIALALRIAFGEEFALEAQ
jgi:hypothetical protein